MKSSLLTGLLLVCSMGLVSAQTPDSSSAPNAGQALPEVLISGLRESASKGTVLNLTALSHERIVRSGAPSLAGALTALPGVSRLSTGAGIGKPVIRGLYGNRVLVLLSSLKFDNQQWQDEHGLGLSDVGVDRVELIRGPASILYGSEAVGGVLNVIEEQPAPGPGRQGDANLRLYSNTRGLSGDLGFLGNTKRGWWRLRAGADNHADYTQGGGDRALNSRFGGYYFKGTLAFRNTRRQSILNYNGSLNNFGFVLEDLVNFFSPDARWSRSLAGPHHTVALNVLSSENTFWRKNGQLKVNVGLQSNLRREDEGGGAVSLNMHLLSLPWNVQWAKPLSRHNTLILSSIGALENNTNYGARIIVPDANMAEQGGSVFLRLLRGTLTVEAGLGVQDKFIETKATRLLNTPDKDIHPFSRHRASANGLLGLAWNPSATWTFKANAATGFRAPNLAELSSNGLHEGVFRYEIGRADLRNEQNLNLEANISSEGKWWALSVAGWVNQFKNYVYLAPTGEDVFGFPVFRYQQSDARLLGGEATATLRPAGAWAWDNEFALVQGERADGTALPFIPAPKWRSRLKWAGNWGPRLPKSWAFAEGEYVLAQNRPYRPADCDRMMANEAQLGCETPTPAYFLLHAGLGTDLAWGKRFLTLRLSARNLLDRRYFDHLSRFKAYGIYEPGRDIVLAVTLSW
ncbi:MAG: TonB-dependent receptor [Saprospiraceae bacterium]